MCQFFRHDHTNTIFHHHKTLDPPLETGMIKQQCLEAFNNGWDTTYSNAFRERALAYQKKSVFDDPPRKNVLLLTCMDQRLLDDTVHFMNELNLENRYDQVALAGGSMKLNQRKLTWDRVFFDHLDAAMDVLKRPIKDIFLFEHLDCGAYKELHYKESVQKAYTNADRKGQFKYHKTELRKFAKKVTKHIKDKQQHSKGKTWDDIRVSCFVMDLLGHVVQLDVGKGESDRFKECCNP